MILKNIALADETESCCSVINLINPSKPFGLLKALNLGYLKNSDLKEIKNMYEKLKLNFKYKKFVSLKNMNKIFKIMINDKKSFGKKTKIILLKKIGKSLIKETTLKKSFIIFILAYDMHKFTFNKFYCRLI